MTLSQTDQRKLQVAIDMLRNVAQLPFDADVMRRVAQVAHSAGFMRVPQFMNSAQDSPISTLLQFILFVGSGSPVVSGPAAPSNPNFDDASVEGDVIFTWTNHASNATANEIWKSEDGAAFFLAATVAPGETSYHDAPFTGPLYIEYKVRAINSDGHSDFTEARGVGNGIDTLVTPVFDYPRLVLQFNQMSLTVGNATLINMPLLRRNIAGGISINSAVLTFLDLSSLQFCENSLIISNTGLTDISLPSLVTCSDCNFGSNPSLLSLSAPVLVNTGSINATGCPALTTASFPSIASLLGDIVISGNALLNTFDLSALVNIGGTLAVSGDSKLSNLFISSLQTVGTSLLVDGLGNLASLDVPALQSVAGDFIGNSGLLLTVDVSSLQTVGGNFEFNNCTALGTISAPLLTSVGNHIDFNGNASLTSIALPLLTSVGDFFQWASNSSLTTVTVPSLAVVVGALDGSNCGSIVTLSFPALVTVGDVVFPNCSALQNISLPVWVTTDLTQVNFVNDALVVGVAGAGTGVDGILRKCNNAGVVACTIDLSGGFNSPPTGGMLNADYQTLVGNGNVVSIN